VRIFDKIKTVDLKKFDTVFRSPGFYRLSPMLLEAEKAGVQITSATKLFFELCPAKIIGVTGTKGKGTTTTLIYEMLKVGGKSAYIAGNIGKPMLELLPKLKASDWVCLELSSFQLQDLTQSPHIAVVLNITSEHLDVHKDTGEYRSAKINIVRHQHRADYAVLNSDFDTTKKLAGLSGAKLKWFSPRQLKIDVSKVKLRGPHNLENMAAAIAAAEIAGVSQRNIAKVAYSFAGLEHRLEPVRTVDGVQYFNDSFSTTPETAIAAIKSFSEPLTIILGGSDKGSDYTELGKVLSASNHVKNIILIGKMAPKIKAAIKDFSGKIVSGGKDMKSIVDQAKNLTRPGGVVVLSPACASFDMFINYKDRGNQFRDQVKAL
jgi:UDP-N-acetylmuramoylalanine--D-glutamate ligase